jgi:hypothetical protein
MYSPHSPSQSFVLMKVALEVQVVNTAWIRMELQYSSHIATVTRMESDAELYPQLALVTFVVTFSHHHLLQTWIRRAAPT